jgi:hypothetical protein
LAKEIIKDPKLSNTKKVFATPLITKQEAGVSGNRIEMRIYLHSRRLKPSFLLIL